MLDKNLVTKKQEENNKRIETIKVKISECNSIIEATETNKALQDYKPYNIRINQLKEERARAIAKLHELQKIDYTIWDNNHTNLLRAAKQHGFILGITRAIDYSKLKATDNARAISLKDKLQDELEKLI